jgi:NAD(P)-dependent dehydrogenase (short-subunit alcohol dehydrogenase family)
LGCDVADFESAAACVKTVSDEVGPVDMLVNNGHHARHDVQEVASIAFLERVAMLQAALDFGGATKPALMRSGASTAAGYVERRRLGAVTVCLSGRRSRRPITKRAR